MVFLIFRFLKRRLILRFLKRLEEKNCFRLLKNYIRLNVEKRFALRLIK